MIDIQTDPIYLLPMKKSPQIEYFEYPLVFNSKHPSTLYWSYPHMSIVGTTPVRFIL